jgi:hypothetical protein
MANKPHSDNPRNGALRERAGKKKVSDPFDVVHITTNNNWNLAEYDEERAKECRRVHL